VGPYEIFDVPAGPLDEDKDSQDKPFDAEFINYATKGTIDLFWLNPDTSELVLLDKAMPVGEPITLLCYSGHVLQAIRREDKITLAEFIVDAGIEETYEIFDFEESFEIELVNYAKDGTVDLFWLNPDNSKLVLLDKAMPVGKSIMNLSYMGHILRAIRREDKKLLVEFHIDARWGKPFEIFDPTNQEDEFDFPDSTEVDSGDDEL